MRTIIEIQIAENAHKTLKRIDAGLSKIYEDENGDPYGSGYVGSQSDDGGDSWYYRGDVGARSREWWRTYCRRNNYILRYE